MPLILPIPQPVLFPLWAVVDTPGGHKCGCGDTACTRVGKHPRVKWGDVTYPGYDIPEGTQYAVKTGAAPGGSGCFVLDADDGEAMAWVAEQCGGEPDTYTVATGRGAHYWWQHPGFPVRRSIHELHPKIDIVGERWWVVGPGSRHRSGAVYTVTRNVPIAPAPDWLLAWPGLRARPQADVQDYPGDVTDPKELDYKRGLFETYCQRAAPAIEGQGGDTALWRVVQHGAIDLRLPTPVIVDVMREHYDPRCVPPWGDALADRVTYKAHSAKTSSTRPAKEPLSYKVASLTGRLADAQARIEDAYGETFAKLADAEAAAKAPEYPDTRDALVEAMANATTGNLQHPEYEPVDDAPPTDPPATPTDPPATPTEDPLHFDFGVWDHEPPPTEFLVEGLLPREAVAMFYGRADSMKTWLLYAMAKALADGKPFLNTYPTKRSKVGIVDFETGRSNVHRRLFMLRAGKNPNLGAVSFSKLKPNDPDFWVALAGYAFDVVFIDSLRRSNPGGDENDSAQAILPLELAAEFAEATGCAVVFIHHAKKAATDGWPEFRGSAAIEDQVDCAYAVRKTDITPVKKTVEVRCEKPGDMRTPDPFAAEVEFDDVAKITRINLSTAEAVRAAKQAETKALQTEIKRVLVSSKPLAPMQWNSVKAQLADYTPTEITAAMACLVEAGEVTKLSAQGGGKYFLDAEPARRKRVFEAVDRGSYKSEAQLASGASVPTEYVRALIKTGVVLFEAGRFSAPKGNR